MVDHLNNDSSDRSATLGTPVRYLFALLSILQLCLLTACASPQIGGPTAPRDDVNAGLLTLPDGRTLAVYPQDLAYSGNGQYRWPDGRKYAGDWRDGLPHGMGRERLPQVLGIVSPRDGESYSGMWREGRRHGHGELTRSDGTHYVGNFVNGAREGEGVESSANGLYRGSWHHDLPSGNGTLHGNNGTIYDGQWRSGQRHGIGAFTDNLGNHYEGDWANDTPHGFGTMQYSESSYEGQWYNGAQSGYGRQINESGLIYEGTWLAGERYGFGRERRPDGREYVGEWLADARHGQGRESSIDGAYHDGAWENNQTLGPGTRRNRTGIEISGVWNDNYVSSGLLTLPSQAQYAGALMRNRGSEVQPRLIEWLEQQAELGDSYAQLFLGTIYADFKRPLPDPAISLRWFTAAAQQGVAEAQFRLAPLIIKDNTPRAIEFLAAAAQQDHPDANALLGEYYLIGQWLPANIRLAIKYLEAAGDAGNITARNNLAWLLATHPDDSIRDGKKAIAVIKPIALLYLNWQHVDTLAAAYAAAGEFEAARASQENAIELAQADPSVAANIAALSSEMALRLALYVDKQSYREDSAASSRESEEVLSGDGTQ